MISVTPLWNSNRSSKPAPRALRSTSLKEKCHISSAPTAKSESLSHTSQSVTATHCRATITFSTTEPPKKKRCANVFCVLVQPCFHADETKKIYRWRHHHADRTRSRSFSVIVVENLYLTTVNKIWFYVLRTRVDEVRLPHAPETIRLPLFLNEDRLGVHPLTHISCAPMAHCRSDSHVKNMFIARASHARDCSAFTSAALLEGFNRMNRRALATQTTSRAPNENSSETSPLHFPPMRWRLHHQSCFVRGISW